MTERFNPIPKRLRPVVYSTVALAGFAAAACGGGANAENSNSGKSVQNVGIENPTVVPTAVPTVVPTAVPTEAPRTLRTIMDQPYSPVEIGELKQAVSGFLSKNPEAQEWRLGTVVFSWNNALTGCEIGDPRNPGGSAKERAAEREADCSLLVRASYEFYKQHGNEELWQIAVLAKNYYVTQYPERRDLFYSKLQMVGIQ